MVSRLIRPLCIAALVCGGLFAMHRGVSLRSSMEPQGVTTLPSGQSEFGDGGTGIAGQPGQIEIRTPERVQVLGPAVARVGRRFFHLGVGLNVAAVVLAALGILGSGGRGSTVVTSLLFLLPAAWALWRLALEGSERAPTGEAAALSLRAYGPVVLVSTLLALGFRAGATRRQTSP